MVDHPQTTPPSDHVDNPVGERIGPCNSEDRRGGPNEVDGTGVSHCGTSSPAWGVSGESDGSETDEAPPCDEGGHEEGAEASLPEPDPFIDTLKRATKQLKIGQSVSSENFEDLAFDGGTFFQKGPDGVWRRTSASMITSLLKNRGYSSKLTKGATCSLLDKALCAINTDRRVDGAAPFLYNKGDTWEYNGAKLLNTATAKIMPAADAAMDWGVNFPRVARVLDNVFADEIYKDTFLAWFKRFYESAEKGELALGQALALVGPVHSYKSFLIERIISTSMGCYADLSPMAAGENNGFTADVFKSAIAVVDDSKGASSEEKRRRYSSLIKKLAAHGKHLYHEKFLTPVMVEWKGRVIMGLNDDPVSIKLLPDLDISNEDKLIVLQMKAWVDHPPTDYFEGIEFQELPHFLAWLKRFIIPECIKSTNSRYGIRSIIAPDVRIKVQASSLAGSFEEILHTWWKQLPLSERKKPFTGTSADILDALGVAFSSRPEMLRGLDTVKMGYRLRELATRGDSGVTLLPRSGAKSKRSNIYSIFLPWFDEKPSVVFDTTEGAG